MNFHTTPTISPDCPATSDTGEKKHLQNSNDKAVNLLVDEEGQYYIPFDLDDDVPYIGEG